MITLNKEVIQNSVRETTRVDRLIKRSSDAHLHRMMQDDPHQHQSMYPTPVSESYSDDEDSGRKEQKEEKKQVESPGAFAKQPIQKGKHAHKKSKFSMMINMNRQPSVLSDSSDTFGNQSGRYQPDMMDSPRAKTGGLKLTIYFATANGEPTDSCEVTVNRSNTVHDVVTEAIKVAREKVISLKGTSPDDYTVHAMEASDEVDTDIKFTREVVVGEIGLNELGLVYRKRSVSSLTSPSSSNSVPGPLYDERSRGRTLRINQPNGHISFVRVAVPGPEPESHVVRIKEGIATLRDLFGALNQRKNTVAFHANFFDFYYQNNIHEPLDVSTPVSILQEDSLVVLPRTQFNSPEERLEAMQFDLVRYANEYIEFSVSKVKGARRNPRILGVDRWRIVKKAVGETLITRDHLPIEIPHIISVNVDDTNHKQFTIQYHHPTGGTRTHTYESATDQNCSEFVNKVKYLIELRKLQP